jgi:hypothetical protein
VDLLGPGNRAPGPETQERQEDSSNLSLERSLFTNRSSPPFAAKQMRDGATRGRGKGRGSSCLLTTHLVPDSALYHITLFWQPLKLGFYGVFRHQITDIKLKEVLMHTYHS